MSEWLPYAPGADPWLPYPAAADPWLPYMPGADPLLSYPELADPFSWVSFPGVTLAAPGPGLTYTSADAGLSNTPGPGLTYTPVDAGLNYPPGADPWRNYTPGNATPADAGLYNTSGPATGNSEDIGDMLSIRVKPSEPQSNVNAAPKGHQQHNSFPRSSATPLTPLSVEPFPGGQPANTVTGRQPMGPVATDQKAGPRVFNQGVGLAANNPINSPPGTITFNTGMLEALSRLGIDPGKLSRLSFGIDPVKLHDVLREPILSPPILPLNNPNTAPIAHGAISAVMQAGGEYSVMVGITDEDDFELEMLHWRLAGLEYDQSLLEIGGFIGDQLVHWGDPGGNEHLPPEGVEVLHAKGPALKGPALKVLQGARAIGQEAHRQILKYKYPHWTPEVTLELIPGVFVKKKETVPPLVVRKDAIKLTNQGATVLIIKPDTVSGRMSAGRRERLMQAAGYKTEIELYNPSNPDFRPSSKKYLGPQ
jgi:hypothetical protein